jgi:hypothetical protein
VAKSRRCRLFAGKLKLKDGEEFLVEIRVTPLNEKEGNA